MWCQQLLLVQLQGVVYFKLGLISHDYIHVHEKDMTCGIWNEHIRNVNLTSTHHYTSPVQAHHACTHMHALTHMHVHMHAYTHTMRYTYKHELVRKI